MADRSGLEPLKRAFAERDKSGKGKIRREDLAKVLEKLGMPAAESSQLLSNMHADSSGEVRFTDFLGWLHDRGARGSAGKKAKVEFANWFTPIPLVVNKEQAKNFCGSSFDDGIFDRGCVNGKMCKLKMLIDQCLVRVASNDDGLLPQPAKPTARVCVVQVYVEASETGGGDKSANGHRYDSIPFGNGMINQGMACYLVHYVHRQHDQFFKVMEHCEAIICRCNVGHIKADGGDQRRFDEGMRNLRRNMQVWPSPDAMETMGAKDALSKIKNLPIGMQDTGTYYEPTEFIVGFKKSMKAGRRVIKQNRGTNGEGVWIISLKSGAYCMAYGQGEVMDQEMLVLIEANDNHMEEHTVAEFIEYCLQGKTERAGQWKSTGTGRYFEGGRPAGAMVTDQAFCSRILEGELRFNMVSQTCLGVVHRVPAPGGMSAVREAGSTYEYYDNGTVTKSTLGKLNFEAFVKRNKGDDGNRHRVAPEDGPAKCQSGECSKETIQVDLAGLHKKFVEGACNDLMKTLGLPKEPLPLWWTADFINASPGECWTKCGKDQEKWVVGEFNCSCVGISQCSAANMSASRTKVSWKDISEKDAKEATAIGIAIGKEAARIMGYRKGSEGKKVRIENPDWSRNLSPLVTKDEARMFCGAFFRENEFDKEAYHGKMDKAEFLVNSCILQACSDSDGLLNQPYRPLKRICIVQVYVDGHDTGGDDKSSNGHRFDTIPIANGLIRAGMACYPIHYVHRQHDNFFKVLGQMDAVVVRCETDQVKASGGDPGKFDSALKSLGTTKVWSVKESGKKFTLADYDGSCVALGECKGACGENVSWKDLAAKDRKMANTHGCQIGRDARAKLCPPRGSEGKKPKVAAPNWTITLDPTVVEAQAKEFCGAAFDKGLFDLLAVEDEVDRAEFLVENVLIKVACSNDGLLEQPTRPYKRTCMVQVYVDSHEFGGDDKSDNGHRFDAVPFANGLINKGCCCHLVHYVHSQHDDFFKVMETMDGIMLRAPEGQIKSSGGDQTKFDDQLRKLIRAKVRVWPSPDVIQFMGSKDSLTKIRYINCGMPDTATYYEGPAFIAGLKKSLKYQRRVIKANHGEKGNGIWMVSLESNEYCRKYGEAEVQDLEPLVVMEACDNHVEKKTFAEFCELCINGKTEKAGTWKTKSSGKYLEGGRAAGGQITDQAFCQRVLEGELRLLMVTNVCLGVLHKVPAPGGMSCVAGTHGDYNFYDNKTLTMTEMSSLSYEAYVQTAVCKEFKIRHRVAHAEGPVKVQAGECKKETINVNLADLQKKFVEQDCPVLMKTLDLEKDPLPLWWSADFINASPGECWTKIPPSQEKWVVAVFRCDCVGMTKCEEARCTETRPNASYSDIGDHDQEHASLYGNRVGEEAMKLLNAIVA